MDVGNLADREEAVEVKRLASLAPQTMAAFVGSSGKSVKILVPFVLPDGSLPEKRELAELFHAVAYRRAVAFYQAHLQRHIEMGRRHRWKEDAAILLILVYIIIRRPHR